MKSSLKRSAALLATLGGLSAGAQAADILVTSNIAVSETWTKNNTYNLQNQVYVLPGATLTIEAGTIVASTTNIGGSLAVCKGAQIFVLGTQVEPVIMTSTADVATWVGGDPKTGTWREVANEWGNLTIMGAGYVSENAVVGNTAVPSASNVAPMEGLVADFPGDTKVLYGGGNDDDDSGTVQYLSMRYNGKVIGLGNELNGLALGGIGRETDIHHIDIMNGVDDGIEIWGGTVNLKFLNIWNIGDDSLDIDQGWRGKVQFGLIVQGHSANAAQGSGVGDNCLELDGAENSDWQPVTTSTLYNLTVIGQPADGDHGTAWRDNARVQIRNSIFMDLGERLVGFDNVDGDGGAGYGFNGTLSWAATWTTPYTATSTVNAPAVPGDFYTVQTSGFLNEITDSVFFRNLNAAAYTEATAQGVLAPAKNNVLIAGFAEVDSPIQSITRGAPVVKGGKTMVPVTGLDPRPKNAALVSVAAAPADGFFTPAPFRGAFAPGDQWLTGWTAADAFGFITSPDSPWTDLGFSLDGVNGAPHLHGAGPLTVGSAGLLDLTNTKGSVLAILFTSIFNSPTPFKGGTIVPVPVLSQLPLFTIPSGAMPLSWPSWPAGLAGVTLYFQYGVLDPAAVAGVALSNALAGVNT
ncbi:MAG: hypothetical protein ACT4PU_07130 [Planctomycetota bacterium]